MPSPLARRALTALFVTIALAAMLVLALPLLASTALIRARIAEEIGDWTGYRVEVGQTPDITLFPNVAVHLANVRFLSRSGSGEPVATVEGMRVELSALQAISGRIGFTSIQLTHPSLYLDKDASGWLPPPGPDGGKFASALETARQAVARNGKQPDISRFPADAIGVISFDAGELVERGGEAIASGLSGRLRWPRLNAAAQLEMAGARAGQAFSVRLDAAAPLILLSGGKTTIETSLDSKPLVMSFSGAAIADAAKPFLDGKLSLTSPRLDLALDWLKDGSGQRAPQAPVMLSATVTGGTARMTLADVILDIAGSAGKGVLELASGGSNPQLSGTLDFKSLDLMAVLTAFSNPPESEFETGQNIRAAPVDQIGIDLRLSAAEASLASLQLQSVAATAQVKHGLSAFDISGASVFDGLLQAGLRIDTSGAVSTGELRVLASDIDGAQMGAAFDMASHFPKATGTISLILNGPAYTWSSLLNLSKGSLSAKFKKGSFPGFDLPGFLEKAKAPGFFALGDVANGNLDFDAAEVEAQISDGRAVITRAVVNAGERRARISGVIPIFERSLALSGVISEGPAPDAPVEASFFVGGSWSAPFVAPVTRP